MRPPKRRILGIDFSGATDAGRKIWVAEGYVRHRLFQLSDVRPACELESGGVDPVRAIEALARHIAAVPDTIAGCDFPFSIPQSLIEERSWLDFVLAFQKRFADPDAFRIWALRKADGRELRRDTDRAATTPFNSYNLRIYRQTWWGIAWLLRPLVISGAAFVHPYQALPDTPRPVVIEACPACSLKSIGAYQAYKGRTLQHRRQRRTILGRLVSDGFLALPEPKIARRLIDNAGGDALDAMIAALAAVAPDLAPATDRKTALEGRIHWALKSARDPGLIQL